MIEVELRELDEKREIACQNPGCWLVHLRAAGDAACDAV